jgi:putative transposase
VRQCAKQQQHLGRQRCDFHHTTALDLVRAYDVIYLEDRNIRTMSRRPAPKPDGNDGYEHHGARRKAGLNKRMHDAGWYACR